MVLFFLAAQKEKVHCICKRYVYNKKWVKGIQSLGILDFFFGGTKKNEYTSVQRHVFAHLSAQKEKYIAYVNGTFTE